MRILTNKDLHRIFHHYNTKFFEGKLVKPLDLSFRTDKQMRTRLSKQHKADALTGWSSDSSQAEVLWLAADLRRHPDFAMLCVLHEMIHISLGKNYQEEHGCRWGAEVTRLWNAGAFESLI